MKSTSKKTYTPKNSHQKFDGYFGFMGQWYDRVDKA
jgi:hypothetical protein